MSVHSMIEAFAASTGTGAFRNIPRRDVVQGLRDRIASPSMINQGLASLCGPASFMYCVLRDSPETYVKYVTQMYATGSASIGKLQVKPSADCRAAKPNGVNGVDWVALASLRDSENTFFDYQASSNEVGGITLPSTMASWFAKAGYSQVTNDTNLFITKGPESLKTALGLAGQHRRVCLLINAAMLQAGAGKSGFFSTANHWIVLNGGDGVQGGKAGLRVWTWGAVKNLVGFETDRVFSNLYGYVAASSLRAA